MVSDTHWNMTSNKRLAKYLAIREVPSLVCEAVNLEGVLITLPEVQTILDGITVGGHKISDQNMVINQSNTWKRIFELLDENKFEFNKTIALELHKIAGKEEAFEWGVFRSGNVVISGSDYEPPSPEKLDDVWLKSKRKINPIFSGHLSHAIICQRYNLRRLTQLWQIPNKIWFYASSGSPTSIHGLFPD